jgi:hypothetical protein
MPGESRSPLKRATDTQHQLVMPRQEFGLTVVKQSHFSENQEIEHFI